MRMGCEGVLGHQLFGYLAGKLWLKAAFDIDLGQLLVLEAGLAGKLGTFAGKVGMFGVRL